MEKWIKFQKGKSRGIYNLSQIISIRQSEESQQESRFTVKTTKGIAFSFNLTSSIAELAMEQIEEFIQEEITTLCEINLDSSREP